VWSLNKYRAGQHRSLQQAGREFRAKQTSRRSPLPWVLSSVCLQWIPPLEAGKSREIGVGAAKGVTAFHGKGGKVRVGGEVPGCPKIFQIGTQSGKMAFCRHRNMDMRKREPFLDPRTGVGRRHGIPQDPTMGGDSQKSKNCHPGKTDTFGSAECGVPPCSGCFVMWGSGVVRMDEHVDVGQNHCWHLRPAAKASASSSSASWLSLSKSPPGLNPKLCGRVTTRGGAGNICSEERPRRSVEFTNSLNVSPFRFVSRSKIAAKSSSIVRVVLTSDTIVREKLMSRHHAADICSADRMAEQKRTSRFRVLKFCLDSRRASPRTQGRISRERNRPIENSRRDACSTPLMLELREAGFGVGVERVPEAGDSGGDAGFGVGEFGGRKP